MVNSKTAEVTSLQTLRADGTTRRPNTWQSVRNDILARIRAREWEPGSLIPTEHELAASMGCARATVNRALRELAEAGIVERRRKVGTRVAATPSRCARLEVAVIRNEIEAMGAAYGYALTKVGVVSPPPHVVRNLHLAEGDQVLEAKSQFTADGVPHCCEIIWLNIGALPAVAGDDLHQLPAHEWVAQNVALTSSQFSILAEGASGDCAVNLDVASGTPVLAIERVNWASDRPVSFARQFYPPGHRLASQD